MLNISHQTIVVTVSHKTIICLSCNYEFLLANKLNWTSIPRPLSTHDDEMLTCQAFQIPPLDSMSPSILCRRLYSSLSPLVFHPLHKSTAGAIATGERCQNGGSCVEGPGLEFTCQCPSGWQGQRCEEERNECESSPCENGAVCVDKLDSYLCACPMSEYLDVFYNPAQKEGIYFAEEGRVGRRRRLSSPLPPVH